VAIVLLGCGVIHGGCANTEIDEKASKAEFHYKLANNYFYDKQIPNAIRELTQCLEFNPDHPDGHHLMGFVFFGRKEYSRAEHHFKRALSIRPGFHAARANLGSLFLAMKRWRDAIEVLEPLVDATLYGTPWLVHNNLGFAHHSLGNRPKAMHHYRLALFHNPKFCLAYYNLGRLYREMRQRDMALDYLRRAAEKCERFAEPHFEIGQLLEEEGQVGPARREYQDCYKDSPESPIGRRCRMRM